MEWSDSAGDGDLEDDFRVRETRVIKEFLHRFDTELYDVEHSHAADAPASVRDNDDGDDPRIPQYYSLGYDAHAEPATAADFREWQQHFPYIRVCGRAVSVALPTEQDEAPDERDTSVDPSQGLYLEACVDQASRCDLAVTGSAVQFHSGDRAEAALESQFPRKREREVREQVEFPNTMHDEERIEEVVASHGILEEVIDINHSREGNEANEASQELHSPPLSPSRSRKYEITAALLDAIWPRVVEQLRPLVERVVAAGRTHGITVEQPPAVQHESLESYEREW